MPAWWFVISIKIVAPLALTGLFIWNLVDQIRGGFIYGGYSLASNIIGGWLILVLCMFSGFVVKAIEKKLMKKGFEPDDDQWEDDDPS